MPKVRIKVTLRITRHNTDLERRLANATGPGLNRAADLCVTEFRKVLSVPNTNYVLLPKTIAGKRTLVKRYLNMRNEHAGIPPFTRTAQGQQSIRRTATGRISMLTYMAFLDSGTKRIQPRPWYLVTILRLKDRIVKLALGK